MVTYKAASDFPIPTSSLTLPSTILFLYSLFTLTWTHQECPNLRAFVLAIPSAWNGLFPVSTQLVLSLILGPYSKIISVRSSLLQFLKFLPPHSFFCLLLCTFSCLGFLPLNIYSHRLHILLLFFLCYYYLHQKCKLNEGRDFICLVTALTQFLGPWLLSEELVDRQVLGDLSSTKDDPGCLQQQSGEEGPHEVPHRWHHQWS